MRSLTLPTMLALGALLLAGCGNPSQDTTTEETSAMSEHDRAADKAAIHEVLARYESALNASDTDAVMQLYTEDGVFMPQHFPSAVGSEAVRQAYDGVFSTIRLSVRFDIVEVEPVSSEWAFARTNSAGTVTVLAEDSGGPEANQELFVFRKTDAGDWKIARYCFSTTNPPRT